VGDSFDLEPRVAVSEWLALTLNEPHSLLIAGACQANAVLGMGLV
jgi:hypothetical protein